MEKAGTTGEPKPLQRSRRHASAERMSGSQVAIETASANVRSTILWSLLSKVISFALRTLLARRFGPAAIAFSDVYLGLSVAVALWPAREVVRRVVLQRPEFAQRRFWFWMNIFWCVIVFVGIDAAFRKRASAKISSGPVDMAYAFVGAGALLEASTGEWLHVQCLLHGDAGALAGRARADGLAALAQHLSAVSIAYVTGDDALGAALGWFAQSFVRVVVLAHSWLSFQRRLGSRKRRRQADQRRDTDSRRLWLHASFHAALKFLASDAENVFLAFSTRLTAEQIGAYKITGNLASMVLRLFFFPLEESVCVLAARTASENDPAQLVEAYRFAQDARLCAILLAILLSVVGPVYVPLFLEIVYGKRWLRTAAIHGAPVARLLAWHLRSLVAAALFGTTDALLTTAVLPLLSSGMLLTHTVCNAVVSIGFVAGVRWAAIHTGDPLLLIANNAITLLVRAALATAMVRIALHHADGRDTTRASCAPWPSGKVLLATTIWASTAHLLVSRTLVGARTWIPSGSLSLWTLLMSMLWIWAVLSSHRDALRRVLIGSRAKTQTRASLAKVALD
jgi:hypothetical protein